MLQKLTDNQLRQNYCLCSGDRLLLVHESVYCSPRVHVFGSCRNVGECVDGLRGRSSVFLHLHPFTVFLPSM